MLVSVGVIRYHYVISRIVSSGLKSCDGGRACYPLTAKYHDVARLTSRHKFFTRHSLTEGEAQHTYGNIAEIAILEAL